MRAAEFAKQLRRTVRHERCLLATRDPVRNEPGRNDEHGSAHDENQFRAAETRSPMIETAPHPIAAIGKDYPWVTCDVGKHRGDEHHLVESRTMAAGCCRRRTRLARAASAIPATSSWIACARTESTSGCEQWPRAKIASFRTDMFSWRANSMSCGSTSSARAMATAISKARKRVASAGEFKSSESFCVADWSTLATIRPVARAAPSSSRSNIERKRT